MTFWRYAHRTSRVAKAMTVVWLFALMSGWANACLLQDATPGRRSSDAANVHGTVPEAFGGVSHAHRDHDEAARHGGHDDGDGVRQLCLSVCDEEQTVLPNVTTPAVPDLGPVLLPPFDSWSFCAVEARFLHGCPLAVPPPPERPVAIRFLRLTI